MDRQIIYHENPESVRYTGHGTWMEITYIVFNSIIQDLRLTHSSLQARVAADQGSVSGCGCLPNVNFEMRSRCHHVVVIRLVCDYMYSMCTLTSDLICADFVSALLSDFIFSV